MAAEVLVELLKRNEAIANLVGQRICPDQAPIDWRMYNFIVYDFQQDKRQRLADGTETGLMRVRFSIYCCSRNREKCREIAAAARSAISVNSTTEIAGRTVRQVFVPDGERDEAMPSVDGQDVPVRASVIDCVIHTRT